MTGIVVSAVLLDSPEATELVAELQAEYVVVYGGPDETPVAPGEFTAPDGAFLVARCQGDLVGCAGLRRWDATTAEIKRMYVRPGRRGQGLGRALLTAAEARARLLGYRRVVLESGDDLDAALGLYRSAGYEPVEPFGIYADSGSSRFLGRDL